MNRLTAYQKKCLDRLEGLASSRGLQVHDHRSGSLEGSRAVCLLLDPESPRDEVLRLSQDAQKCFRKATVRMGNGASLPYAPEIIYKTIYLLFY